MDFVINHYLVAWSCRGMCGTKHKNGHVLVLCRVASCRVVLYGERKNGSCRMLSCRVVSSICELALNYPLCLFLWKLNGCSYDHAIAITKSGSTRKSPSVSTIRTDHEDRADTVVYSSGEHQLYQGPQDRWCIVDLCVFLSTIELAI